MLQWLQLSLRYHVAMWTSIHYVQGTDLRFAHLQMLSVRAGGDGPKLPVLQHMVLQHRLQERVHLLGAVAHR